MSRSSEVPGFYRRTTAERREFARAWAGLSDEEVRTLDFPAGVNPATLERMIENVIGVLPVPVGLATNFQVNGRDYLVPMAIEEPSVVAAASNAAKVARAAGGFQAQSTPPVMIGQVQIMGVADPAAARLRILDRRNDLLAAANAKDPVLVRFGGGAKELEVRVLPSARGTMVVVHLLVDARDAGGMNAVNTMCEALAPELARLAGGRAVLRIISNLAVHRLARARATFRASLLATETATGPAVVEAILDAYAFAAADPFRCATHNKGIMNGVVAVGIACGQDIRALEAGAHSYASKTGKYKPLTTWEKNKDGDLVGKLEMPMAVGLVGGAAKTHPTARADIKILGVKTAIELAEVMGAVGLAQNFAALRALASEGIQRGHMKLHAHNVASSAGATGDLIEIVAAKLIEEKKIRFDRAKELVEELSKAKKK